MCLTYCFVNLIGGINNQTCLAAGPSADLSAALLLLLLESAAGTFLLFKGRQLRADFFIHTLLLLPPSLCLQ